MGFKRKPNRIHNSIWFVQHLVVPETHDTEPRLCQHQVAIPVFGRFHMLAAIYFDHELDFQANKIKNEITERVLAPEFMTIELAAT